MFAVLNAGALGELFGGLAAILVVIAGVVRWAHKNIVKPLKIVTGERETNEDPGKPSLYQLTKEAKVTSEKALAIVNGNGEGNVLEIASQARATAQRVETKQREIAIKVDETAMLVKAQVDETATVLAEKVMLTAADLATKVETTTAAINEKIDHLDSKLTDHVVEDIRVQSEIRLDLASLKGKT